MLLRSRVIKLAVNNPELRPLLLEILKTAVTEHPSEEAMREYLKEHPNAKPENHIVRPSHQKPETNEEIGEIPDEALEEDAPASKEPKSHKERLNSFLSGIKGISKSMADSIAKSDVKLQTFIMDPEARKASLSEMAEHIKKAPAKMVTSIYNGAKKELKELKHAGHALKKALGKPPKTWDAEDKKAVYSAALYVAGAALAAAGGPAMVAGAIGKSFAIHVATKAIHHVLDAGFTHFEAGEVALHGAEHILHVLHHVAADEDAKHQESLIAYLTVAVGEALDKGVSSKEMESILKGSKEPEIKDLKQPKQNSKEAALFCATVELARNSNELNPHLMPILKSAKLSPSFWSLFDVEKQNDSFAQEIELTRRFLSELSLFRKEKPVLNLWQIQKAKEDGLPIDKQEVQSLVRQIQVDLHMLADKYLSKFSPEAQRELAKPVPLYEEHAGPPTIISKMIANVNKVAPAVAEGRLGIPLLLNLFQEHTHKFANSLYVDVKNLPATVQKELKGVGYNRKNIKLEAQASISLQSYPDDGQRAFAVILDLVSGSSKVLWGSWGGSNINTKGNVLDSDDRMHPIPMNGAVIKGVEGGMSPVLATLYVNPNNMNLLLSEKVELSKDENKALAAISGLKGGKYRAEAFERMGLGEYSARNPVVQSLSDKGLVKITGTGIQITTEGKNSVDKTIFV